MESNNWEQRFEKFLEPLEDFFIREADILHIPVVTSFKGGLKLFISQELEKARKETEERVLSEVERGLYTLEIVEKAREEGLAQVKDIMSQADTNAIQLNRRVDQIIEEYTEQVAEARQEERHRILGLIEERITLHKSLKEYFCIQALEALKNKINGA